MNGDKRIRVIRRHSDANTHRHHLFFPGAWRGNPPIEHLDAIGRRNNGGWWRWLPLICAMDQDCPARVLVRADLIEEMADAAIEASP
jgi:hypothetical protein